MTALTRVVATAAIAALIALPGPALGAGPAYVAHYRFDNDIYEVRVDTLAHGQQQEGKSIKPGKSHVFGFDGCKNKDGKTFRITMTDDGSFVASGSLNFEVYKLGKGGCNLYVKDPTNIETIITARITSKKKTKQYRVVKVKPVMIGTPRSD